MKLSRDEKEEKEASLKELKHILEKAYVEDNEPQPKISYKEFR